MKRQRRERRWWSRVERERVVRECVTTVLEPQRQLVLGVRQRVISSFDVVVARSRWVRHLLGDDVAVLVDLGVQVIVGSMLDKDVVAVMVQIDRPVTIVDVRLEARVHREVQIRHQLDATEPQRDADPRERDPTSEGGRDVRHA